jgi:hypothetical protein
MICEFNEKKNLVRAVAVYQRAILKMQQDPSINIDAEFAANFSNWQEAKEAAERAINGIKKEGATSPSVPVSNIDTTGNNYATDISLDNVSACYGGDQALYQQMQNAFQRKMLAASVLEIYADGSMEYRDPNVREGNAKIDRLSTQIIAYKNELINTIRKTIGEAEGFFPSITENTSDFEYQTIVNSALEKFAEYFEKNSNEKSARIGEGFDAYMILKNFDALLTKLIPYVKIDPSYGANNLESVRKYSFQPTVKHRTNFSKDEQSDITKQFGNLAETILKVIPDIDENGNMLSSNVGVSGFNGAMQTLKRALMTQKMFSPEDKIGFRKSVINGAGSLLDPNNKYNLSRLIDKFIYLQSGRATSGTGLDEYRQTYLFNKLRSIKKYLLNPKTPNYIKNMFVQLFLKTEDSNYRVYNFNKDIEQFEGHSLKTNMYLTQQYAFEDVIKGGIKQLFESSSNVFATNLLSKYNVSFNSRNRTLTIEKVTENGTPGPQMSIECADGNVSSAKFSVSNPDLLSDFMLDAYGYYIPDTYPTCIISNVQEKWVDDFAPYIALAVKLAKSKVDPGNNISLSYDIYRNRNIYLRSLKDTTTRVAERLGTIYGESIKSTIKGVNSNSLPLYGLTSLQFNWRGLLDEIPINSRQTEQAFGLFAATDERGYRSNADMIGQQIIRNEVQVNGVTKDANKMNTNELNKLAIIDDFWFPANDNSSSKAEILMQNATFSDKGRQFLVSYDIKTELKGARIQRYLRTIYGLNPGETLTVQQMIDMVAHGDPNNSLSREQGEARFSEFIRNIRRDKYIAAALNVLKAYKDAGVFFGYDTVIAKKPLSGDQSVKSQDDYAVLVVQQLKELDNFLIANFKDIQELRDRFKNANNGAGVDFVEETYAYVPKAKGRGKVRVNETLIHYCDIASNLNAWDNFIAKNKSKFADNISKLALSGVDTGCGSQVKALLSDKKLDHKGFYNSATQVYKLVDKNGNLHSIANAYFYCDILFSQEFNSLTIGEIWAHPNKNKDGVDEESYLEYSEANRLVNQIKRSVIFGSTIHSFGQGILDDRGYECGVTPNIDIAIIADADGPIYTINGVDSNCDPQDGSGWCTALQSNLENNSLSDAAVGDNKKTIIHSIDPKTGTPTLLKWAVYSLTNSVRRNGQGSKSSPENLVRRMYSRALNLNPNQSVDLNEILAKVNQNNYYIWDNGTGKYRQLIGFKKVGYNIFTQLFVDGEGKTIELYTLYDVDQLFGGAFSYRQNNDGTFSGMEDSVSALTEFAVKYNQRDKQIAYAVNASACKVGATNVNSKEYWENGDLRTYNISMRYGGVLMNADHDLDEAEVTEMSQMISALIEDGHYTEEVRNAYGYIGTIALENPKIKKAVENSSVVANYDYAVKDLENAKKKLEKLSKGTPEYLKTEGEISVAENKVKAISGQLAEAKQKIREIVGRALMDTFDSGKDEIGLAQAFCNRAKRLAKSEGIELNIPFDDSTLWGAVISSLNSKLTKDGIRRKHPGFAGVLNPSHNMIMYYEGDGGAKLWKEFEDECREKLQNLSGAQDAFKNWGSWQKVAVNEDLGGLNPYFERISDWNKIDFEDTIRVWNGNTWEPIYIDSFDLYDKIRNQKIYTGIPAYKLKAAPRNLRGCDTLITLGTKYGFKEISLYNTDEVRALFYISKGKEMTAYQLEFLKRNFGFDETQISNDKYIATQKAIYTSRMQFLLHQVETSHQSTIASRLDPNKKSIQIKVPESLGMNIIQPDGSVTSEYAIVSNYATRPAEIIMGRYQMEKFGLNSQDHIANIKDETYFIDKLNNTYGNFTRISKELDIDDRKKAYDYILFKNGKPVYVKVGDLDPNINDKISKHKLVEYNVVGDDLRIGSEVVLSNTGKEPFPVDDFQFYTITSSSEPVTYIMCKTNEELNALKHSDYFDDFQLKNESIEDSYIKRIARNRYKSFTKALEYVGARVPTQAMQSFMPFKVLAFSDSEQNVLYVPKANTFIEGSDFDIDKLYLLARSFNEMGEIRTGTAIQREIGFEAAVRLSRADSQKVFTEGLSGSFPLNSKILEVCGFKQSKSGDWYVNLNSDIKVDNFVYMFNKIYTDPSGQITFDKSVDNALKQKVINLFNQHSKTSDYTKNSEEALKMRMFDVIYDITRKIENQHKAQITVDTCTEELKERTKNTVSGNAEKKITPYNPASKFMMQEQNQLGKAVVGIGAVSLKTYFILSTNSNTKVLEACQLLDQDPNNIGAVAEKINLIKIWRPDIHSLNLELTTIANTNLDPLIDRLKKLSLNPGDKYDELLQDVLTMKKNTAAISAPEFLSGIISLAADNAKELALPKLNATSDLVDIYTTAAMLGYSFKEISDIMCSPIFNWLTEIGAQNIFDETSLRSKVKDAIGFASLSSDKLYPNSLIEAGINAYNRWAAKRTQYYERRLQDQTLSLKEKEEIKKEYDQFISDYKVYWDARPWLDDLYPNLIVPDPSIYLKDKDFLDSIVKAFEYNEPYFYYDDKGVVQKGAPLIPLNPTRKGGWSDEAIEASALDEGENFGDDSGYIPTAYEQADYYKMYRGFKAYQERLNFLPDDNAPGYASLIFLNELLKSVEEMSTLGQVGSINQGLKTNINDFYTATRRIDDFLRRRLTDAKKRNKNLVLTESLIKLSNALDEGTFTDRFLTDDTFADEMIWALEEDRRTNRIFFTGFNILDALKNSPNFHAMARIMPAADIMLRETSAVYRVSSQLADKFKVDKNIKRKPSENDFKCISNYVQDYNIYSFIEQAGIRLDLSDFGEITWYKVPNALEHSALDSLDIKGAKSIASFKHIFENYIVPMLQKKYGDNIFLKSLIHKYDTRNKTDVITLPISLMEAQKDVSSSTQYANYLQAFNAIANENFAGNKIGDLFFLYNLVTFKNGFGRNSLTKMFEGVVQGKNVPPIINAYYEFIARQSKSLKLNDNMIKEAQWYVNRNSIFTQIPAPANIYSPELTSDYTFILPTTAKLKDIRTPEQGARVRRVEPNPENNPVRGEGISKISMNNVSPLEFIGEFANYINSRRPGTISVWSGGEDFKNVRGMVQNGYIYINTDKFTDVSSIRAVAMHELAHIFLASVKAKDPEKYYNYIAKIGQASDFDEIAKYYPNSIGTDLQEEVFCCKLEKVLAGSYNPNDQFEVDFANNIVPRLLKQLDNFAASFADRGDEFIMAMRQNAKLSALKTRLYNSKDDKWKLEQNCNESF